MKVREIMTDRVQFVSPEATLKEASRIMDNLNIGSLPILQNDRIIGIVTDRDIIVRAISEGLDPNTTCVKDAMTSPVVFCFEDQKVEEAVHLMERERVRRLVVMDRNFRLTGLLSIEDLLVDLPDKKLALQIAKALSLPIKSAS